MTHDPRASPGNRPFMDAAKTFLQTVIQSGLVGKDQLALSLRALPPERLADAKQIASHLVQAGQLSRFQAEKLLLGKSHGLILGNFQILAPIGKGGISVVYLARDARTHELVALKTFSPKRAERDERALVRFHREMELSRLLDHSNIAYVFEIGISMGIHFLAMEYVQGKSLSKLVAEQGPLSVSQTARIFVDVTAALDHAHQRNLIHRDIKPSNIMVTPEGRGKVLDFGLALVKGEKEHVDIIGGRGFTVGTMDYLPPEQAIDASTVDERADLYCVGGSMYYAITGRPPFPGGTKYDKVARHRKERPEAVSKLVPGLSANFATIIHKLLAKHPANRFESAQTVQDLLMQYVE